MNNNSTSSKSIGNLGEEYAAKFLMGKGLRIIERNFKTNFGEIDIIAENRKILVFVEVKSKESYSNSQFLPEYNITPKKKRKLRKLCEFYLSSKKYPYNQKWQIDVIAVYIDKSSGNYKINHIESAIWETEY